MELSFKNLVKNTKIQTVLITFLLNIITFPLYAYNAYIDGIYYDFSKSGQQRKGVILFDRRHGIGLTKSHRRTSKLCCRNSSEDYYRKNWRQQHQSDEPMRKKLSLILMAENYLHYKRDGTLSNPIVKRHKKCILSNY